MGRPKGARNRPDRAARKILNDSQFSQAVRYVAKDAEVLNSVADGSYRPRNVASVLGALRLKAEFGYSKPKQETELSGNVTISVASPLPGSPGSSRAKVELVANEDAQVLCLEQRPIMGIVSTKKDENDDASTPAVMAQRVTLTAEQRRAAEREAWLADKQAHPDAVAENTADDAGLPAVDE